MQGLSISDLRSRGADVRHTLGINTCARCRTHYLPAVDHELVCRAHTHPAVAGAGQPVHSCCQGQKGSRGCQPVTHLPMYQVINGKVEQTRVIDYSSQGDLHVKQNSTSSSSSSSAAPVASSVSAPHPSIPLPLDSLGDPVPRLGDEIMVCGQLYHTGTPVILWGDVGGYDHYRVERRFCPFDEADWATTQKEDPTDMTTPNRFGLRKNGLTAAQVEAVRGGQWDLPTLQSQMRELVLHYDEAGLSRECFKILQDQRCLSIHFMLDLDGTIYQALDLKERAWQATIANTNSCGVEIANIGSYDPTQPTPFAQWYTTNAQGQTTITIPASYGDGGIHTPNFVGQPSRPQPIAGNIQGQNLIQYDYTPQQYAALTKLVATFVSIFPAIPLSYPRDATGALITHKLADAELAVYKGILGHYHIQTDKIDPGPAFQWDLVVDGAKEIVLASQLRKARFQPQQQQQLTQDKSLALSPVPSRLAQALASSHAANVAPNADVAGASPSKDRVSEWNLMRKMERKLLTRAEDAAAAEASITAPFYLVDSAWYAAMQAWLDCTDGAVLRPSAPTNTRLLGVDERTPLAHLKCPRDYRPLNRSVWVELIELYGAATPIIRQTVDIYAMKDGPVAPVAAAAAAGPMSVSPDSASSGSGSSPLSSVSSPPSYSSPVVHSQSSSSSGFVVPSVSLADGWMYVSKKLTGQ